MDPNKPTNNNIGFSIQLCLLVAWVSLCLNVQQAVVDAGFISSSRRMQHHDQHQSSSSATLFSSLFNPSTTKTTSRGFPVVSYAAQSESNDIESTTAQEVTTTTKSCGVAASRTTATTTNNNDKQSSSKSKKLYTFVEAKKLARGHGFSNKQEFLDYSCPGAYQLPKNPDIVWSNDWTDWDDWLGIPYEFIVGRSITHTLQLKSQDEYIQLFSSDKIIIKNNINNNNLDLGRLPYRPDLYYKNNGWVDWNDWLGVSEH